MKNLSAIHRLSLLETFTILITLVVCLAGFTEAEGNADYKKQDSNQPKEENYLRKEALYKENAPYYQQPVRISNEDTEGSFDDVKNMANSPLENFKRESEDFGESDDSDQKEGDGYGYDDDEYYHFNMKRSDTNLENKAEKEGVHELNDKEAISGQKKGTKEKSKEGETIEMLNFKESHPNSGVQNDQNPNENKPFSDETSRKKVPNSPIITSLKMSDFRENSAIDEKMKDRKDESSLSGSSSDTKLIDSKKQVKTADEKDSMKLKDTQLADDVEKKEKETSLKEGKDVVATKTLKDTPEDKEKGAKLSENVKLEDTIEKMTSKTKETDSPKIAKEETEESKVTSDFINPNGLSQMSNRASFVNNEFKDNSEVVKNAEAGEEETSEEMSGIDANIGLNDYQKEDLRRSRERLRKLYNVNVESGGTHLRDNSKKFREFSKPKEYMANSDFQSLSSNDLFKKRDWKEQVAQNIKFRMQQQQQQEQEQQAAQEQQLMQDEQQQSAQQPQMPNAQEQKGEQTFNPQLKNSYGLSFPANELENTEYHKNFIKSLKRYKGISDEQKKVTPETSGTTSGTTSGSTSGSSTSGTTNDKTKLDEELKNLKKEFQDPVKMRPTLSEEPSKRVKFRRNSANNGNSLSSDSQSCMLQSQSSQSSPKLTKNTKLKDNSRIRRKSQKVEYEIKVFNQNQQGDKNAELSQGSKRFEKDIKMKTRVDKYSKKYPYSQASRDDLTRILDVDGERKFKRKAPIMKRHDQKSVIQTRAVPSGYYGNRVKFGQKNYARNNDRAIPEAFRQAHVPSPTLTGQAPGANDKNKMLRSWEVLQPNYRHESIKRYDAAGTTNKGNSLLLVRKGDRITTAFEEGNAQSDNDFNPDNLAKILSNNNDYIVLKKTESNKFQKMYESNPLFNDYNAASYPSTYGSEEEQQESQKNGAKQTVKNRGLFVRASHFEKEKKPSSGFHSSKSNLKKTFAKFRDLAGFFKDNEQESADNQYPTQELKEGRDIVFSEDKRPDPIVINGDMNEKNFNQKPLNSMYSISNNFKTLDQPDKKSDVPSGSEAGQNMFTAEAKAEGQELSWGSTIKNLFPEAKSVNTIAKNGNEIIVLDMNRNVLKPNHALNAPTKSTNSKAQLGSLGFTSQIPSGKDKKSMLIMDSNAQQDPNSPSVQKTPLKSIAQASKAYSLVKGSQSQPTQLEDLPNLLKALMEMKPASPKVITKRSSAQNKVSENYNKFLQDLNELSELNKNSYKKVKQEKKRGTVVLPSSSFPELSNYGDANIKYLGGLLQNIMTGENPQFKALNEDKFDGTKSQYSEENRKLNQLNEGGLDTEWNLKYQGKWSLDEDKNKDTPANKGENDFEVSGDRNYQEKLWDELAATSDKVNRLRREGAGKRKLRKAIEDSLDFKQKSGSNAEDSKLSSGDNLNGDPDAKERSGREKSEYEGHLSELFENLNKNQKNQINLPNESTWKRKKRKGNQRRKRSPGVDNKNKVSTTTAVQNTILKTFPEANYQSVYSPGIKRMLLSTKNEADNADNYSDAYEHDKDVTSEKDQANCVRNKLNNCVDPIIVELFKDGDMEEEKTRARRSLNAGFHSNFKREIDLDESMPNDFQSFLVTSLGGFGSQKREVMKKDDALWEGKATSQDGSGTGDSALEKRDVSSSEKRKSSTYKNEFYPQGSNPETNVLDVMGSFHHAEKKVRSDEKSKLKGKSEFSDEKLPTQIRIQITNASTKEKKSSKPIMDESESTSTETENLPKEKEFFDKGKISTARGNNLPKLRGPPKSKLSYADFEERDNQDNNGSPGLLRRRRRKKKKFAQENPAKPIKDFMKFDSKVMETFLKRIMTDQGMNMGDQTTQKLPVSNHLPQVETVYNPTQGTNKAQLETTRFGKLTNVNNKNSASDKNNMQENDPNPFDEGVLRSFLKDKTDAIKSDKVKDYEDVDWKPSSGKMRLRQELGWDPGNVRLPNFKTPVIDSINANPPPSYLTPYGQHIYGQKFQPPNSNYFYHPATSNVYNTKSLYDAVKLKQDMKSHINEHPVSKLFKKPMHHVEPSFAKSAEKDKNAPFAGGEGALNYEFALPKKSSSQVFKNRDMYGIKNQNRLDSKNKLTHIGGRKFMMNFEEEKPPIVEPPPSSPLLDNSKDPDYMDGLDEDYLDESDTGKDSQMDDSLASATRRKSSKLFETPGYHQLYNYKNPDLDDNMNEDEEEVDEDYEENSEDEDFDDYSLLTNSKAVDPEIMRNGYGRSNFDSSYQPNNAMSPLNYVLPQDNLLELRGHSFEQTEFTDPHQIQEAKFSQGKQFPIGDVKPELDSISTSSALLKKANENSNILEKNMMKNEFGYNYDDNFTNKEKVSEKVKDSNARLHHNKLTKRRLDMQNKFKRSRDYPQIGSRLFYAAKTEVNSVNPFSFEFQASKKSRNSRNTFYRRNPFYAEFADPENSFENESEENGEKFNGNLANLGRNSVEEKNKEKNEEEDLNDVAENLEDDGETISEDNVLENVIGKYIMRKRVASPTELNKAFVNPLKKEEGEAEDKHKLNKRSSVKQKRSEKIIPLVKVVSKRLSSGHLTENNFRKYHKKNLNKKRQTILLNFDTDAGTGEGNRKTKKRGHPSLSKRSALDLFKKITNKDRDNKKVENIDGRTAGFEPLSSLNDKKYESSIHDLKQEKPLMSESLEKQMQNNLSQLKTHHPSEIALVVDQPKKERTKDSPAQGPWKIELNDVSETEKLSLKKETSENLKASEAPGAEEGLKALLVFSTKARAEKRSPGEDSPPASGSLQKEVGNSYQPKSGEGRRIFKRHVRKRSLDPSLVTARHEDSAQARFAQKQTTENHVFFKEKNRALHDTMSLFTSQPSRVPQRDSKKIRSFVNADEQCQPARFPPKGKLNKRQSVFPPSNDANSILVKSEQLQHWTKINKRLTNPSQIMRDSRHVNEETSKYLGRQIVDAILSHVSANPKFKELIAPGLASRTTAYKEDIDIKQRPVHQADISAQLQLFLQKFMYDLEKLAEKRVQKRMCNEIDPQSRQFLESLLRVSINEPETKKTSNEKLCAGDNLEPDETSDSARCATEKSSTKPPTTCIQSPSQSSQEPELENLKKKHSLLQKVIEDYEKLTKLEKESLQVNYQNIVKELQATQTELEAQNYDSCSKNISAEMNSKTGSEDPEETKTQGTIQLECVSCKSSKKPPPKGGNKTPFSMEDSATGSETKKPKPVSQTLFFDNEIMKTTGSGGGKQTKTFNGASPENGDSKKSHDLPTLFFDEEIMRNSGITFSRTTPSPFFENVEPVSLSDSSQRRSKTENTTGGGLEPENNEASLQTLQTPQSFDLLPCQNFTQKLDNPRTDQPPESVQIKESLSGANTFENSDNRPPDLEIPLRNRNDPTELHKLNLEDEIGLLLKKRGPWVRSPVAPKTVRNAPTQLNERILGLGKGRPQQEDANDDPTAKEDAKGQSSTEPSKELPPDDAKPDGFRLPIYPFFKSNMFVPRKSPFETVSKSYGDLSNEQIPLNFFLRKDATTAKKQHRSVFSAPSAVKRKPSRPNTLDEKVERRGKILPPFLPLSVNNKRKKSSGSRGVDKEVDDGAALEYLAWSNMPTVRRQMNNLERGFEFDEFFSQDPKRKKT